MISKPAPSWIAVLVICLCAVVSSPAQLVLNEILFNPPGTPDAPNEYIELRGPPNYILPNGCYLLTVDGDAENPGRIENVFDLSDRQVGGNGFLVLLQKTNSYTANQRATILQNTGPEAGFGDGRESTVNHRGAGGSVELLNPSMTVFLVVSAEEPRDGDDVDVNNDGLLDSTATNWVVLDSVGIMDNDGPGDFGYGLINFRRIENPATVLSGFIVNLAFTPKYVGRTGNTTGSAAADWLASNDLQGTAPNWLLHASSVVPSSFAGRALNHIGSPNFGAAAFNGIVAVETEGGTDLVEGGSGTDTYQLGLNTRPAGPVEIEVSATAPLELSVNGSSFSSTVNLTFSGTNLQTIIVRSLDDNVVDTSPFIVPITHRIVASADAVKYPTSTTGPLLKVHVQENDWLLLSEIKVNPAGVDEPFEFVEIIGPPGAELRNVYFLGLEGQGVGDPGEVDCVVDLDGVRLGAAGLLLVVADGNPYSIPSGSSVQLEDAFAEPGGALGNNSVSFMLVSSRESIRRGDDLDGGDDGVLSDLGEGSVLWDAVGWRLDAADVLYGGVELTDPNAPDAVARFPGNFTPLSAAAWYYGDLSGDDGLGLKFEHGNVSRNFPLGTELSPGLVNNTAPTIFGLHDVAGAIGDPTNPKLTIYINDQETDLGSLALSLTSTNPAVVPDSNLILEGSGAWRTLTINPAGVGYSKITLTVNDGRTAHQESFRYAASAQERANTRYHFGASDASSAIPLDADYMLIADDENQTIRLYARGYSGGPIVFYPFTDYLGLTDYEDGVPREVDIEASTRAGDRIFWMGAHSHANLAETRTNRSRLFATRIAGAGTNTTLTYLGRYDFFKLDLVNWDMLNGHGRGANYYGLAASTAPGVNPKTNEGFNIEGLTMAPGSDEMAYVACRAPIVPAHARTDTLIIPVLNFGSLAVSTGPPGSTQFGTPIELDLMGRGVRSIERIGSSYLIVAGPPHDFPGAYPNDFRFYTWSGQPQDPPEMRTTDLRGMNVEGIIELPAEPWDPDSPIQLLNDCGRKIWYGDGVPGKQIRNLAFKKFSSDWVTLGDVASPEPVITQVRRDGETVTVWWRSFRGLRYGLQHQNALGQPIWTDVPGTVTATGPITSHIHTSTGAQQGFYRVVCVP